MHDENRAFTVEIGIRSFSSPPSLRAGEKCSRCTKKMPEGISLRKQPTWKFLRLAFVPSIVQFYLF